MRRGAGNVGRAAHRAQARRRHPHAGGVVRLGRGVHRGPHPRLPDVGAAHGGPAPRARAPGARRPHGCDARLWPAARVRLVGDTARRQALDRWRRRQGVAGARAARGGVWRRRADDVGPRAGPYRRHPRQARGDPGVPHGIVPDGSQGSGDEARLRDDRADARDRPRRPPALRAARRDGHGRGDSPHCRQHHVEEARRRAERARAGREARHRRVPPQGGAESRARADDDRAPKG